MLHSCLCHGRDWSCSSLSVPQRIVKSKALCLSNNPHERLSFCERSLHLRLCELIFRPLCNKTAEKTAWWVVRSYSEETCLFVLETFLRRFVVTAQSSQSPACWPVLIQRIDDNVSRCWMHHSDTLAGLIPCGTSYGWKKTARSSRLFHLSLLLIYLLALMRVFFFPLGHFWTYIRS